MATRSPFSTPSSVSALAALLTSLSRSAYVIVRVSPGSPSQWKATLSPLPASTCRSTQLYDAFSSPPTNHLANGAFHSSTVSQGFAQVSRLACSSQKPSRSALARSYASALTLAASASSSGGSNRRFSLSRLESVASLVDSVTALLLGPGPPLGRLGQTLFPTAVSGHPAFGRAAPSGPPVPTDGAAGSVARSVRRLACS